MKYLSVAAVVCLLVPTVRSEDKPDYAKLIIGKWEVTSKDPGNEDSSAIVEFMKDGKAKATMTMNGETKKSEGTYTLNGDKLKTKFKNEREVTITKLTEKELSYKHDDGVEMMLKRIK